MPTKELRNVGRFVADLFETVYGASDGFFYDEDEQCIWIPQRGDHAGEITFDREYLQALRKCNRFEAWRMLLGWLDSQGYKTLHVKLMVAPAGKWKEDV